MVLEGRVNGFVLVVQPSLFCMLAENSFLLRGRHPCWDVCCSSRIGRENEGGYGYKCILFGRDDEAEVAVLASTEIAIDGQCVRCQELMGFLDVGVVRLAGVLGY